MTDLRHVLVRPETTLRAAMEAIDRNTFGLVLVVDEARRLVAPVTDGDVRRAVLAAVELEAPLSALFPRLAASREGKPPLTAAVGTPPSQLLASMKATSLRHIPLLDPQGVVVDLCLLSDLVQDVEPAPRAVVMAGGFGTRLRPLTNDLPKPMLPVGDKPLLEHIVGQLRTSGITNVNVTTHFRGDVIERHFGDGQQFGVHMSYVQEEQPLGTAGAVGLVPRGVEPLLVVNGDILTKVNYRAFADYHREHRASMTIGVRQYDLRVPYGVVESDGVLVTGISEKPLLRHFVSAGIYLLAPDVPDLIPRDVRFDMPDLIRRLLDAKRRVVRFPISEYWIDIGQPADYERAQADAEA